MRLSPPTRTGRSDPLSDSTIPARASGSRTNHQNSAAMDASPASSTRSSARRRRAASPTAPRFSSPRAPSTTTASATTSAWSLAIISGLLAACASAFAKLAADNAPWNGAPYRALCSATVAGGLDACVAGAGAAALDWREAPQFEGYRKVRAAPAAAAAWAGPSAQ